MMRLHAPFAALALALATIGGAATAQDTGAMRLFEDGEAISFDPDKAYILLRHSRREGGEKISPILLRVPGEDEMRAYFAAREAAFAEAEPELIEEREKALRDQARAIERGREYDKAVPPVPTAENFNFVWEDRVNLQNLAFGDAFYEEDKLAVWLLEAPPGEYVLYGASYGGIMRPGLHVCFCLGTIGFTAKAGEVTDMGTFLSDIAKTQSDVPELVAETGFGPSTDVLLALAAGTIRPVQSGDVVPAPAQNQPVVAASYSAVGRYFHPGALGINRLAPIPGILDYDRGDVIDVQTGEVAHNRH